MENTFTNQILAFLKDYFSPLITSFETPESALNFFTEELGWNLEHVFEKSIIPYDPNDPDAPFKIIEEIPRKIEQLIRQIEQIKTSASEDSILKFAKIIGDNSTEIYTAISNIKYIKINTNIINEIRIEDILLDILSWLTLTYLGTYQIKVYNILNLLKIIDTNQPVEEKPDADGKVLRLANYVPKISFDKIIEIIKTQNISDIFNFDTVNEINAISGTFIEPLVNLINSLGLFCVYGAGKIPYGLDSEKNPSRNNNPLFLEKYWIQDNEVENFSITTGFLLSNPDVNIDEGGPGIFVNPEGSLNFKFLEGGWSITADADLGMPFKINKGGIVLLPPPPPAPPVTLPTDIAVSLLASYSPTTVYGGKVFQLGKSTETNISIQSIKARFFGDFNNSKIKDTVSYGILAEIIDFILTLKIDDPFIKAIIPEDPHVKFNFEIGYSNKNGFHFGGSGGLDLKLAQNIAIGPVLLKDTRLSLKPKEAAQGVNSGLEIMIGTNISAILGPLGVTIEELGFKTDIEFPANGSGNLGLINLLPGIKFPTRVGLSLDTKAMKASGFLKIDTEKGEYLGAIAIDIDALKFRVAAIGIITARPPGGVADPEYFSLLIIITAEFPPMQLGFGFTLTGLGGLLGYKRSMLTDNLRAGIKANTLDGILFPKVVVNNIGPIVSNLQQVFPATTDQRFLIGPMMKITWGTPKIITAEVGIIIELPTPVQIAILGVVRLSLPNPGKEILHLQINFLGIIDLEKKLLSIDSALEDSRVLTMTLTGQFALRIGWGSIPLFIFSAGGFHPDFKEAPVELQGMQRLGLKVIDEEFLKLNVDSYFALTTNTVQFGAHAHVWASMQPYVAVADASFDALILFNPFAFTIGIDVNGRVTGPLVDAVIQVQANLTGPNRWHIWGHAYIKLVFEITIPFDTTFGEPVEELVPETIDISNLLKAEVAKATNWKAVTPANNTSGITIRNLSAAEMIDSIIVHPDTTLSFNQQLVPLELTIDKFGNKLPLNDKLFSIPKITAIDTANLEIDEITVEFKNPIYDLFAPGNFLDIPAEQKLSRPSFERMQSGKEFTVNAKNTQTAASKKKNIDYEVIYLNTGEKAATPLGDVAMVLLAGGGAAAKSKLSLMNNRQSYQAPLPVIINKAFYNIVQKANLKTVTKPDPLKNEEIPIDLFGSQAEAYTRQPLYGLENTVITSTFES
ncbi:MAG: hypothetical protein NTX61_13450 [Bacteroidetes bacterium]|nr:hypothetical protein [Bacteroidota bacterium]